MEILFALMRNLTPAQTKVLGFPFRGLAEESSGVCGKLTPTELRFQAATWEGSISGLITTGVLASD